MKKLVAILVMFGLLAVLVAACSSGGATSSSNSNTSSSSGSGSSSSNDVHMGSTNFAQSSVTISKGSSINLIDDAAVTHIISNGSWVNGTPKPSIKTGAPTVKNLTFNTSGQSQTVGPFNTAGTYHLYCSVHVNMNLTVIVQ